MSVRESIIRYHLIIGKLKKQDATFIEINDFLSRESEFHGYNFTRSEKTFQRDREDIRAIYNINIEYDFKRKVYTIINNTNDKNLRLTESIDLFNALKISENTGNYIHFEKRRPLGTENMNGLLHAIQNRLQIKFTYFKFWDNYPGNRITEPYALKEFKNRWYLMALDHKDTKLKVFALDRLNNLIITQLKFIHKTDFNVNEYFKYCFGIITSDKYKPEEVVLSFDPFQGKYIKTLPLHETQQVLLDNDDELIIKLNVYTTFDLVMEILSYGENVKVLKPESLAKEIKSIMKKTLNRYK